MEAAEDTHTCGQCQESFTVMEQFARHKYVEHGLRFTLSKSFTEKPRIFYPDLVPYKKGVTKEAKSRMTFNRQLLEMETSGDPQAGRNIWQFASEQGLSQNCKTNQR